MNKSTNLTKKRNILISIIILIVFIAINACTDTTFNENLDITKLKRPIIVIGKGSTHEFDTPRYTVVLRDANNRYDYLINTYISTSIYNSYKVGDTLK
jgi:hypothetical protein